MKGRAKASISARITRVMAAFFTLTVAVVVTGCVRTGAMDAEAERSVVEEFFDLLAEGDAEGAGELMLDPTFVTPGGLDNEFYSEAIRPENPRVVSVGGFVGNAVVTVEYTVRGQDVPRRVDLEVSSGGDEPKIVAWGDSRVGVVDPSTTIRINDARGMEPGEDDYLVLLPGIYEFEYDDELGITALGSVAGEFDTAPFPFEFPVTANETDSDLADGVRYNGSSIFFEIRIREGVTESVEAAMAPGLQQLLESCTAERLVGPSCPVDLVEAVEQESSAGEIDTASISWTHLIVSLTPLDGAWVALQQSEVEFERDGVMQRYPVDVIGTITKDASGQFVVTIDPTLEVR